MIWLNVRQISLQLIMYRWTQTLLKWKAEMSQMKTQSVPLCLTLTLQCAKFNFYSYKIGSCNAPYRPLSQQSCSLRDGPRVPRLKVSKAKVWTRHCWIKTTLLHGLGRTMGSGATRRIITTARPYHVSYPLCPHYLNCFSNAWAEHAINMTWEMYTCYTSAVLGSLLTFISAQISEIKLDSDVEL